MFSLGLHPTGSKDPFALRRAGNGIVKILAESALPLTIFHLFMSVSDSAVGDERTWRFFNDRVEFYLRDIRGFSPGVVSGVMSAYASFIKMGNPNQQSVLVLQPNGAAYINDVRDAVLRAEALTDVLGSADFEAVCGSFKQIKGILSKAKEEQLFIAGDVKPELLLEEVEGQFNEAVLAAAQQVELYRNRRTQEGYVLALREIAALRPQVAAFFDRGTGVMVMAPEPEIRANRLAMLERTFRDFSRIADFSEIVTSA
jgi:glycyl-tRNA synthetase beta chain